MPALRALPAAHHPSQGCSAGRRCLAGWPDIGAWYEGLSKAAGPRRRGVTEKAKALVEGARKPLPACGPWPSSSEEGPLRAIPIGIGGFQASRRRKHPGQSLRPTERTRPPCSPPFSRPPGVDSHYLIVNTEKGSVGPGSPALALQLQSRHPGHPAARRRPRRGAPGGRPAPRLGRASSSSIRRLRIRRWAGAVYSSRQYVLLVAEGRAELLSCPIRPGVEPLERPGRFVLAADGRSRGRSRRPAGHAGRRRPQRPDRGQPTRAAQVLRDVFGELLRRLHHPERTRSGTCTKFPGPDVPLPLQAFRTTPRRPAA